MEINIKPPSLKKFTETIKILDLVGIAAGAFLLAVSIQGIMIPGNLLTGGLTGLAIVLEYIFKIDVWIWYALLNIPLLIAGYKYVSRRFIFYSIFGAAVLTIFLALLKYIDFGIEDIFLSAVFGGALSGVGSGLIFRSKGSTGGIDIVAVIIRRFWGSFAVFGGLISGRLFWCLIFLSCPVLCWCLILKKLFMQQCLSTLLPK